SYLMQKSSYNNHYYLVWLVSGIMAYVPAHAYQSIDAKNNPNLRSLTTPKWVLIAFKLQIALVYIYAAIAKLYPGWYENKFLGIRLNDAAHWFENTMQIPAMTTLLRYEPFQYFLTYSGIAFDFLIIPMLLIKKTRKIAFIGLLTFHLMNSIILQIGIFPYFAIAFAIFYFPADYIERLFFRKKRTLTAEKSLATPDNKSKVFITIVLAVYFAIQLFLPIRHWLIPGDVLWTEEGHRLSWRMMLRTKSILHYAQFTVKIPATQTSEPINLFDYVTKSQAGDLSMKPDMIWQFAQYLEKEYQKNGVEDEIEVYVYTKIGVNGSDFYLLADPDVDLTAVNWNYFGHQDWLLDTPAEIK
ncbi:MAG: HTTM domain-containing protein, partial [Chitinophagales bacterium]